MFTRYNMYRYYVKNAVFLWVVVGIRYCVHNTQHSAESTHIREFLANSKKNSKKFYGVYCGLRDSWLVQKIEVENLVRLSL
jgi:hypothetical protein